VYLAPHAGEKKYNSEIYERFIDLFKTLPLCALIDNKYFAVHGGLSPAVKTLGKREDIQPIYKNSIAHRKSQNRGLCATFSGPTQ
jgi:diadenosine tetraphosphatase ApaH/serine/threonine PP2A family protein phosphatase